MPCKVPYAYTGYSVAQELATGSNTPGKLSALDRAGLKKETGQSAGVRLVGVRCFQQWSGRQTEGGYWYLFRWKRSG